MTAGGQDEAMKTAPSDRTAILIVRMWMEPHPEGALIARVTQTLDSNAPDHGTASASAGTPQGIYALVQQWVEAFTGTVGIEAPAEPA